ncbi:hypothetical protein FUA26_14250 [Seonamhaeicola algicola]|uniref:DUF2946 domain-containing protein n=1 Tax=Seonamhaeicola algicola TaxID=1719036 RepID=A0A5C7AD29_9FLAO|nr:hypothetical protein [Seonamhaeicola algicola]TXE06137.1 hypothetical protein FUA26_14250 [Seonamhaeicola algicola]
MVKQFLHKGFCAVLALLVLISTVSFTVEKHYCGDVLIDVSLFADANKCGMETQGQDLEKTTKKSCCKDEVHVVEGQDKLLKSSNNLEFQQQLFITSFVYTFYNLFESLPKQTIPHKDYSPPKLTTNILVLDQVFLI